VADEDWPESIREPETVALLFDLARDRVSQVIGQVQSLQGRGTQAFAAATVLIGFATLASPVTGQHSSDVVPHLLIGGGVAYALAALASLVLLLPAKHWGLPDPQQLWATYAKEPSIDVKNSLFAAMVRDWEKNSQVLTRAKWAALCAVVFVAAEGGFVAAAIIRARWGGG
jgi:hypothetical protein